MWPFSKRCEPKAYQGFVVMIRDVGAYRGRCRNELTAMMYRKAIRDLQNGADLALDFEFADGSEYRMFIPACNILWARFEWDGMGDHNSDVDDPTSVR